jgi:hypothetical protein
MSPLSPCTHEIATEWMAIVFLLGVYRLQALPRVLDSDMDPRLDTAFWLTLWRRLGTKLNMSSNRHPQNYGLTKRAKSTFQQLQWVFTCYDRSDWVICLSHVEFAYNASGSLGIEHTPFEANCSFSRTAGLAVPNAIVDPNFSRCSRAITAVTRGAGIWLC